jgi:hypothetical protein
MNGVIGDMITEKTSKTFQSVARALSCSWSGEVGVGVRIAGPFIFSLDKLIYHLENSSSNRITSGTTW